jgi:hypothetical protein
LPVEEVGEWVLDLSRLTTFSASLRILSYSFLSKVRGHCLTRQPRCGWHPPTQTRKHADERRDAQRPREAPWPTPTREN